MTLDKTNIIKIITKWTNPNFDSIYFTYKDVAICRLSIYEGDNFAIISDLYVDESFRRKGIGSLLLKECEKELKNWNVKYIKLYVNKDDNASKLLEYYKNFDYDVFEGAMSDSYTLLKRI